MKDLGSGLNFNYKSLERKSSAIICITPKRLTAIIRFYHVLKFIQDAEQIDWKLAATACGYYDQAHLINELKKYTGQTPDEFVRKQLALPKILTDTVKLTYLYTDEQ